MSTCVAVEAIGCDGPKQSLTDLMGDTALASVRQSRFVEIVQNALETAAARPTFGDSMAASRADLVQGVSGTVGSEKLDLVSGVARPGAVPRPTPPEAAPMAQLEQRVMDMYADLTNYQIAWKIAQRIQQDTSQLLKGS